jgi:hypothetical protein
MAFTSIIEGGNPMKTEKGLLADLYDMFVLRDVMYVVSGSWILFFLYYSVADFHFDSFLDHVTRNTTVFFLYIAMAYFLGLLSYLTIQNLKYINTDPCDFTDNYHRARAYLQEQGDTYVTRCVERSTFMQMAAFTIFTASIVSAGLLAVKMARNYSQQDLFYLALIVLVMVISRYNGDKEVKTENGILCDFAPHLKDRPLPRRSQEVELAGP